MKIRIFLLFVSLIFVTEIFADTKFYRASYRDDPSTSIVIGWCSDGVSTNAAIYYDVLDYGQNFASYSNIRTADRIQEAYGLNHNFARLAGLLPNTIYYFVIKDEESISQRMYFKTLPDNSDESICFISGGDSRTGSESEEGYEFCRYDRQVCDSLVGKIRPDFVAFNGDFVNWASAELWSNWFADWQSTIGENGRIIPIVPVLGNHEEALDIYNLFDVPNASSFFSLGMGGNLLRLYSLNTSTPICDSAQRAWLENDLQLHTNSVNEPYWKFAQYHVPFVPHASYAPNFSLIDCWVSLFEQYKIRLVAEAHAHVLKTTHPIVYSQSIDADTYFVQDDVNGIVYIGEGSWGAPKRNLYEYSSPNKAYQWTRGQVKESGFQLVCVSKDRVEVRIVLAEQAYNVTQVEVNDPVCTIPDNLPIYESESGSVLVIQNNVTNYPQKKDEMLLFRVLPNPTSEESIELFLLDENNESFILEIYNSLGILMINKEIYQNNLNVDVSNLSSGTYYFVLKSKNKTAVEKVTVL